MSALGDGAQTLFLEKPGVSNELKSVFQLYSWVSHLRATLGKSLSSLKCSLLYGWRQQCSLSIVLEVMCTVKELGTCKCHNPCGSNTSDEINLGPASDTNTLGPFVEVNL